MCAALDGARAIPVICNEVKMPFITDRLEHTKREQNDGDSLAADTKTTQTQPEFESALFRSRFKFDPVTVNTELQRTIVGQKRAIRLITDVLCTALVGLGDPRKPIASILYGGPTGVGKTEVVRTAARAIHGNGDALCRIDMNTLSQEHYAAAFTGAPPGYIGSKEGTTLLDQEKIEGTSSLPGIVLFDELEKASGEVIMALLNILDNGLLTVASGERTISFRNSIVFMTTNIGSPLSMFSRLVAKVVRRRNAVGSEDNALVSNLMSRYPPEFVNRIDHIHMFHHLQKETLAELIDLQLGDINRRLARHGLSIKLDREVRQHLCDAGYDRRFGARELRRTIRTQIEFSLARFLMNTHHELFDENNDFHLVAHKDGGRIIFDVTRRAENKR